MIQTTVLLVTYVIVFAMYYTMAQFVPLRVKYRMFSILAALICAGFFLKERIMGEGNVFMVNVISLAVMAGMILFALWAFAGPMWKRFIVFLFLIMFSSVCDFLTQFIQIALFKRPLDFQYASVDAVSGIIISGLLQITFFSVIIALSRFMKMRRFNPVFLLLPIFPLGQLALIGWRLDNANVFSGSYLWGDWISFAGVAICLISDIVLLIIIVEQDRKSFLQEELRETRHKMELEQSHYREVEQRREELAKIRHDFNNHLSAVEQLIRSGDEGSARNMISALSKEIIETKDNPYCGIPVVNAVLTGKTRVCAEAGIALAVDLILPDPLSVEPMHLCSIFGNMLDNAINACRQAEDNGAQVIQVSSMADGDYLFIKTVNPSGEPPKKNASARGYGSRILSDIATRYGGDYRTEYKDGTFTAMVSLLAVAG